jgi:hypothetical protein
MTIHKIWGKSLLNCDTVRRVMWLFVGLTTIPDGELVRLNPNILK